MAYTVLLLLMFLSLSKFLARVIQIPLPLLQSAVGAILTWSTSGWHVELEPRKCALRLSDLFF